MSLNTRLVPVAVAVLESSMAKDIPRAVVKRMVKDYQRGALFSPSHPSSPSKQNVFWAYNSTNSVIEAGKLVLVSGFAGITTYAQAYQAMLNNELSFVVTAASGTSASKLATTVDSLSASSLSLGRIRYDGLSFILAHINNDSHTELDATGESVASDGVCDIVAKSPKNASNYAVCAIAKKSGGGGGGTPVIGVTVVTGITVSSQQNRLRINYTTANI